MQLSADLLHYCQTTLTSIRNIQLLLKECQHKDVKLYNKRKGQFRLSLALGMTFGLIYLTNA